MKKIAQQQKWKDALKVILREDLEAIKEVDGTYEEWVDEIFSGNMPDAAYELLEQGDQEFGVEEASQMFKDVCDSLNLKHAAGSLNRKANSNFVGRSLASIEAELAQMELKGLEDTPKYKALNEYANELAAKANRLADEAKIREEEQRARQKEQQAAEEVYQKQQKIQAQADQIQQTYDRLSESEWGSLVMKHYPIKQLNSNTWIVESLARDWNPNDPKAWMFASKAEAQLKVLQLVRYRHFDYFERMDRLTQKPPRKLEAFLQIAKKKSKNLVNPKK